MNHLELQMSAIQKPRNDNQQANKENKSEVQRIYRKPRLKELGDLRTLTLGASISGYEDSSGGAYSESFPIPPTPFGG